MPKLMPVKKPIDKNRPLKPKVKNSHAMGKLKISEQAKEIARLQKLLVKSEVKYESEIANLKAKLAEEKKRKSNVKFIIHGANP